MTDVRQLLRRVMKYVTEGFVVALAAHFIPRRSLKLEEVVMVALTAAASFAILDMFAPSVGIAARQGAGFGIGGVITGTVVKSPALMAAASGAAGMAGMGSREVVVSQMNAIPDPGTANANLN